MGGLHYETGRDMPPGMQALTADKLVKQLREAAQVAETLAAEMVPPVKPVPVITNGDRIRAMSNENLAQKLFGVYQMTCEHDYGDIANNWCDMKGGCCGTAGEELDCDEDKHKACILRWLQSEVAVDARIG